MSSDKLAVENWLRDQLGAGDVVLDKLHRFVGLLNDESLRQNLISAATRETVWSRHVMDSAQLLTVPRETVPSGPWLDLGTGAGFPGLIIAILRPKQQIILAESRRLRCDWLRRAASELSLANVTVAHGPIESMADDEPFAVISARAFAPLDRLLALAHRFSTPHTLWLLPKGSRAAQELASLSRDWRTTFHVEQSLTDPSAGLLVGRVLGRST